MIERRPFDEALAWAEAWPAPAHVEDCPLARACGRVLARDLHAGTALPPEARAAADGYALLASDTLGAGDYAPLPLQLLTAAPGLRRGQAIPVAWGDRLPAGADAVLPREGGDRIADTLEVATPLAAGNNVARMGEECAAGARLASAGQRLRPQDLALLALASHTSVPVWQPPRVRILLAGRAERDANGPLLQALVQRDGGHVADLYPTPGPEALHEALLQSGAELILVVGASGEGQHDHAPATLARGGRIDVPRPAIHPGGNALLGRCGATPVVLLPGTPLACLVAYDLLVSRLLRRMSRQAASWPYTGTHLPLAGKLSSQIGRLELCRVRIRNDAAEPVAVTDGRILATAVGADGFVLVPADSEGHARGERVLVHQY